MLPRSTIRRLSRTRWPILRWTKTPEHSDRIVPHVFNDVDINSVDNDSLTLTVVNQAALISQGLVSTSITQTAQSSILTLDYLSNRNGVAEVIVQAMDSRGATVQDTFTVTVRAVNDSPVIGSSQALSAAEDTLTTLAGISITTWMSRRQRTAASR